MRVGLYFGSFNPIHHGHLIVGSYVCQNEDVDEVWFVVSPQNPFKTETGLLNEYHRLYLTRLAVEGEPGLKVSDVEFKLPKPSYTIDTLQYLENKYPTYEFALIMGSDSYSNIEKWKEAEKVIKERKIYVYQREGFPVRSSTHENVVICNAPLMNISASLIRKILRKGRSIRYYVPENVREEIDKGNYYR